MPSTRDRALGLARRNAHRHAFDRAFQGGGEVADPPPGDPQDPVEPYTMAQPDYMRPKPSLEEQVRGAIPEPLWEAGSRVGEALRTGQPPAAEDYPMIAAGAILGTAGPKGEGAAERAVGQVAKGIRAYHGSPYDFPKFSMEHVGSGEGAQAYGHGLYFAEAEPTAKAYKEQLKDKIWQSQSGPVKYGEAFNALEDVGLAQGLHRDQAYQLARQVTDKIDRGAPLDDIEYPVKKFNDAYYALVAHAQKQRYAPSPGHMYEVNINADPEHFLDWDKPLSEQHPKVQEALGKAIPKAPDYMLSGTAPRHMHEVETAEGAAALRQAGIPGIKYLDQGSRRISMDDLNVGVSNAEAEIKKYRAVGNNEMVGIMQRHLDELHQEIKDFKPQSHNYVVFDDKLIDIVKKYGLAGLIAGGAAHYSLPASEGVVPKQRAKGGKITASQMAGRHAHQAAFDKAFPRR